MTTDNTTLNVLTFRVSGLLPDLNVDEVAKLLSRLLDKGGFTTGPNVRSLGLDPHSSARNATQVATVDFSRVPADFRAGSSWVYSVSGSRQGDSRQIMIDSHFQGWTPLNGTRDEEHNVDFIAIGGLDGHPFGTWQGKGDEFMWLRDKIAENPQGARILLYGYDSALIKSRSSQDIEDMASKLVSSIQRIRPSSSRRPLVFIAHDLGGLIVKEAILQMESTDTANFLCIYGLLFCGVPNRGIATNSWMPIVKNQPNEKLIRSITPGSLYLRDLQSRFDTTFTFSDARIVSVYETMRTKTLKEESPGVWKLTGPAQVMVTRESARDWCPWGPTHDKIAFNQNHIDLPRFAGPWDSDLRCIETLLGEFCRESVAVVQRRF